MLNDMSVGREQDIRNRRPDKQTITDFEEEEDLGVRQNPRVVERIDFGATRNPQVNTPLRVYEWRNQVAPREREVENQQQEQPQQRRNFR